MLEAGADANIQDESGWILFFLCHAQHKLGNGRAPAATTHEGETALHILVKYDDRPFAREVAAIFIEGALQWDPKNKKYKRAPAVAELCRNLDPLSSLVKSGVDLYAGINEGESLLNFIGLLRYPGNEEDMAKMARMVAREEQRDFPHETLLQHAILQHAIRSQNWMVVRKLLQMNSAGRVQKVIHYSQFMQAAIHSKAQDCARFIFGKACYSQGRRQRQLYFYRLSLTRDARVGGTTIGLDRPPLSLYRMCRVMVRSRLPKGPACLDAVDQLPLPRQVLGFVAFRE